VVFRGRQPGGSAKINSVVSSTTAIEGMRHLKRHDRSTYLDEEAMDAQAMVSQARDVQDVTMTTQAMDVQDVAMSDHSRHIRLRDFIIIVMLVVIVRLLFFQSFSLASLSV
jgi:hypothetical protein